MSLIFTSFAKHFLSNAENSPLGCSTFRICKFHLHLILINCFECLDDVKPLRCYLIIFFSLNRTILNRCWILIFTHRFTLAEFLWNLGKKSFCSSSLDRGYFGPNILVKYFSRFHFSKYTINHRIDIWGKSSKISALQISHPLYGWN